MNVLLNATRRESEQVGGDWSQYQDWARLGQSSGMSMHLSLAPETRERSRSRWTRKVVERLAQRSLPQGIRRRMLERARRIHLPGAAPTEVDVILSHLLLPQARLMQTVPTVWSSQGIAPARYYERNGGRWTRDDVVWFYRRLGPSASLLLVNNHTGADALRGACPELGPKVRVVPPAVFVDAGLEVETKRSSRDGIVRLLFVGSSPYLKGLDVLLAASRATLSTGPSTRVQIVAPRAARPRPGSAPAMVRWLGLQPRERVQRLMAEADVLVLPSRAETYGLAAAEGLAHGCAVIVSDFPPLPEVVPPEAGWHVPVGDPNALAEALRDAVNDEQGLRSRQREARSVHLRRHRPERVATRLHEILCEAARG